MNYLIVAFVLVVVIGILWRIGMLRGYSAAGIETAVTSREKSPTMAAVKRTVLYRAQCLSGRNGVRPCDVVAKLNDGRIQIHIDGQPDDVFHRRHASKIFPLTSSIA